MSDIVERLIRSLPICHMPCGGTGAACPCDQNRADVRALGAEIERLRAELAECRAEMAEAATGLEYRGG